MTTPAEDFAAVLARLGVAPEPEEQPAPDPAPGPRAPRPDPSQGLGTPAPADPAAYFHDALQHNTGPGGASEFITWTRLA